MVCGAGGGQTKQRYRNGRGRYGMKNGRQVSVTGRCVLLYLYLCVCGGGGSVGFGGSVGVSVYFCLCVDLSALVCEGVVWCVTWPEGRV